MNTESWTYKHACNANTLHHRHSVDSLTVECRRRRDSQDSYGRTTSTAERTTGVMIPQSHISQANYDRFIPHRGAGAWLGVFSQSLPSFDTDPRGSTWRPPFRGSHSRRSSINDTKGGKREITKDAEPGLDSESDEDTDEYAFCRSVASDLSEKDYEASRADSDAESMPSPGKRIHAYLCRSIVTDNSLLCLDSDKPFLWSFGRRPYFS